MIRRNKIIIFFIFIIFIAVGLSAQADYTVTTQQPLYQDYSSVQPYAQYPQYQQYQGYYPNPYQCQGQYVNPYQYQNPYGYGTAVDPTLSGNGTTGAASSILRNVVQSLLYSRMRGY